MLTRPELASARARGSCGRPRDDTCASKRHHRVLYPSVPVRVTNGRAQLRFLEKLRAAAVFRIPSPTSEAVTGERATTPSVRAPRCLVSNTLNLLQVTASHPYIFIQSRKSVKLVEQFFFRSFFLTGAWFCCRFVELSFASSSAFRLFAPLTQIFTGCSFRGDCTLCLALA